MTRTDPAYNLFRTDAETQGFDTLADYFRHYGIVPPAPYGRPKYKDREFTGGMDADKLDALALGVGHFIDKSWGEPGRTITR